MSTNANPRIVGHGRTFWLWDNNIITWANRVSHTPPSPLGQAVDIHPLNYVRPAVIAAPRAITRGEITLDLIEPYGGRAWKFLRKPTGEFFPTQATDLADIFHFFQYNYINSDGFSSLTLKKITRPPGSGKAFVDEFKNVQILNIQDGEEATADAMINITQVTVGYTERSFNPPDETYKDGGIVANEDVGKIINSKIY